MSIHPSLSVSEKNKKQRSVLKRAERLRMMLEKSQWKEGDRVFGLPKIKTVRIKIKKEKVAKAVEAAATEAAPTATATTATPTVGVKEQVAPLKTPASKGQDKK